MFTWNVLLARDTIECVLISISTHYWILFWPFIFAWAFMDSSTFPFFRFFFLLFSNERSSHIDNFTLPCYLDTKKTLKKIHLISYQAPAFVSENCATCLGKWLSQTMQWNGMCPALNIIIRTTFESLRRLTWKKSEFHKEICEKSNSRRDTVRRGKFMWVSRPNRETWQPCIFCIYFTHKGLWNKSKNMRDL